MRPKIWLLGFVLLWSLGAGAQPVFVSADSCSQCHEELVKQWETSRHARSTLQKDALYRGMFEMAMKDTEGKLRSKCMSCHSPFSLVNQNFDEQSPFHQEGVTCMACHGAKSITPFQGPEGMTFATDTVYSGRKCEDNWAHPMGQRDYFSSGQLCLTCHGELKNPRGISVCTTGHEWEAAAANGEPTCLDCHMPMTEGRTSHRFAAFQDEELFQHAVDLQAEWKAATRQLTIQVVNNGAAHTLPTGTPLRMIVVKAEAYGSDGQILWTNWKENPIQEDRSALFMKVLGSEEEFGPLPPWKATRVSYDRRLQPGEPVTMNYQLPDGAYQQFTVKVLYRPAPPPILKKLNITDPAFTSPKVLATTTISAD